MSVRGVTDCGQTGDSLQPSSLTSFSKIQPEGGKKRCRFKRRWRRHSPTLQKCKLTLSSVLLLEGGRMKIQSLHKGHVINIIDLEERLCPLQMVESLFRPTYVSCSKDII